MKIAVDTNLIVRVLVDDDPKQAEIARRTMRAADTIFYPTVALCEAVWTLRRHYRLGRLEIAEALTALLDDQKARTNWDAFGIGVALLRQNGDFADALIAVEGRTMGADVSITFDRKAARLLKAQGVPVTLLG